MVFYIRNQRKLCLAFMILKTPVLRCKLPASLGMEEKSLVFKLTQIVHDFGQLPVP